MSISIEKASVSAHCHGSISIRLYKSDNGRDDDFITLMFNDGEISHETYLNLDHAKDISTAILSFMGVDTDKVCVEHPHPL